MLHAAMSRRRMMQILAAGALLPLPARAGAPTVIVYQDPTCGCCGAWSRYLEAQSIKYSTMWVGDHEMVRKRLGVPDDLAACHTAEAEGYVIEGHMPLVAIRKLWKERPRAIGLAVAGMPLGSPGMAGEPENYDVILFTATGRKTYMRCRGDQQI
jgi:hypothetical protein